MGGVGCVVAEILARCGVGRLILLDCGEVDPPDLSRQMLYTPEHVGEPKARAAEQRLREIAPDTLVEAHRIVVGMDNIGTLLAECAAVADCLDNFTARFALAEALPAHVPLVHTALRGGFALLATLAEKQTLPQTADAAKQAESDEKHSAQQNAATRGNALRALYQGVSQPKDIVPVAAPGVYALGAAAAREMLNCIWKKPRLAGQMLLIDLENFIFDQERFEIDPPH